MDYHLGDKVCEKGGRDRPVFTIIRKEYKLGSEPVYTLENLYKTCTIIRSESALNDIYRKIKKE